MFTFCYFLLFITDTSHNLHIWDDQDGKNRG